MIGLDRIDAGVLQFIGLQLRGETDPAALKQALKKSELGALLVFDVNNIRYITSTKIGEWERDKLSRWALLTRTGEPILWDFGSAAVHHKLYTPWLAPENCKAGLIGLRGGAGRMPPLILRGSWGEARVGRPGDRDHTRLPRPRRPGKSAGADRGAAALIGSSPIRLLGAEERGGRR